MTLYSLNGGTPAPLPFRLIMPDGSTRTDPATFTSEEISSAGYIMVPEKPLAANMHQLIEWNGSVWTITDTRTLESAKELKLAQLKVKRQDSEKNLVFNGMSINLDNDTQSRINNALTGFDYVAPGTTTPWEVTRGIFIDMDKDTLLALGLAGWNHIRNCYINAQNLSNAIIACTTIAEIDNINLDTGWP